MKIIYALYNAAYVILFIVFIPLFIYRRLFKGKYRRGIKDRFGKPPAEKLPSRDAKLTIWIHAVSVGETAAAAPVADKIMEKYPQCNLIFSTTTDTGQNMAQKIIKGADAIVYFPLDFSFSVKGALDRIDPDVVILTETELWPNFIRISHKRSIKLMLINGRISDDSFRGYKLIKPFMKRVLKKVDCFSMQSEKDKKHILQLGAIQERVFNSGNTKFDMDEFQVTSEDRRKMEKEFNPGDKFPVIVAGSTHPDEEEQFLSTFKSIKEEFDGARLILAPRHIKRTEDIASLYEEAGFSTVRRTDMNGNVSSDFEVILLDTIGELAEIYSIGDLVFVGGSLVNKGGHNILEPAMQGKMVFFGPHMQNFRANVELVKNYEVGIQVENSEQLTRKMLYYLRNRDELHEKGRKARKMVEENRGAALENAELLAELLQEDQGRI